MQSTLRALAALVAALAAAAAWVIRQLVALTNGVHQAGHATGIAWHRWGRPALLATAKVIARAWVLIDWSTAAAILRDGLAVTIAGTIAAAQAAPPALVAASEALGRRHALLLGVAAPMAAVEASRPVGPVLVIEACPAAVVPAGKASRPVPATKASRVTNGETSRPKASRPVRVAEVGIAAGVPAGVDLQASRPALVAEVGIAAGEASRPVRVAKACNGTEQGKASTPKASRTATELATASRTANAPTGGTRPRTASAKPSTADAARPRRQQLALALQLEP